MSRINLGEGINLDLGTLLRTRMLIAASSGGGKSWLLRRLLEQSNGKVQQIILDYEGEFSTLREKFDYVLVGKGGEVAADIRYAPQLVKRLLELNVSAIVDLYELQAGDRKKFVRIFLETLINLPKDLWHPCLIVVDEAHVFCPEKGKGESEASGAVIDLATRGRKRGYCAVLATQDIAKLNKDASGECRNRLIGLAVEDKTRDRSAAELGMTAKDQILALRNLEPGEFYSFGPAIANEVKKVRIGSVQTSHPEVSTKKGRARWAAPPPPREKVKAILSKLEDLPKEADEEANTVRALHQQVGDLKRQLREARMKPTAVAPQKTLQVIKKVEVPILKDGQVVRLEHAITKAMGLEQLIRDAAAEIVAALRAAKAMDKNAHAALLTITPLSKKDRFGDGLTPVERATLAHRGKGPVAVARAAHGKPETHLIDRNGSVGEVKIGGPERKILSVLAQYTQGRTVTQTALLTGYAKDGGAFRNPLSKMRAAGFIDGKDVLKITEAGLLALGDNWESLPPPGPELFKHWLTRVGHAEREILRVLSDIYPDALTVVQVAERTESSKGGPYDPDGGAFRNPLSRLRTLELVEGRGELRLNADLMDGA